MGQFGFFDADKRLAALSAKGDPLEAIDRLVPWESFRADIEAVVLTPDELRKSSAGRKPLDAIVMFRMLVLQALNNLSDEQVEYQVRDRMSFTRFLRLGIEDSIPDATTVWLFREKLAKAGLISLRSCSTASTSTSPPKATWRVAGRWLTPRLCRSPSNATVVTRTRR
jgi:IS5 family transposase